MIGSLLYLTASRLDIAFNVGVCDRFQSNPKESHLNVVKRIIKYDSGTCDFGFFFIAKSQMSLLLGILILIGLVMLMIGKAPLEGVFMWEQI